MNYREIIEKQLNDGIPYWKVQLPLRWDDFSSWAQSYLDCFDGYSQFYCTYVVACHDKNDDIIGYEARICIGVDDYRDEDGFGSENIYAMAFIGADGQLKCHFCGVHEDELRVNNK